MWYIAVMEMYDEIKYDEIPYVVYCFGIDMLMLKLIQCIPCND